MKSKAKSIALASAVKIDEPLGRRNVFQAFFGISSTAYIPKSILLWWFFLFYVLVYNIFCAVGALCVFSYF